MMRASWSNTVVSASIHFRVHLFICPRAASPQLDSNVTRGMTRVISHLTVGVVIHRWCANVGEI